MVIMNLSAKLLFVLMCTLVLNSCTIKISYRFLDNLIGWQISQYVDLKGAQKKAANEAIDEFHKWHRQTQLRPYADYMQALKAGMMAGPIAPDYLHVESNKIQDFLDISVQEFLPIATEIAASLSEDQIQEVLDNMEREKEEYQEDYIDAKPRSVQKRRIKDITRYIGGFFGGFTEQQKQRLIDWEESLVPYETFMLAQQTQWQNDFREAMNFQDDPVELEKRLLKLMLYRTDNWDSELQARLDTNQELTFDMLADLFNNQTEKQQKKMERKFDQYIDDLKDLSKEAKSPKSA